MNFLKNKMNLFETIVITIIIISTGIYILEYNNSHFEPIKGIDINNIDQWYHGKHLEVADANNIIQIISYNNVYASWFPLNSKGFNVYSGETILLSIYSKYFNTAQSALRLIGNTSSGEIVLGYAFIVNGNSTWKYYSMNIIIPNDVSSVYIQMNMGWVISNIGPEIVMLKDISLYNVITN